MKLFQFAILAILLALGGHSAAQEKGKPRAQMITGVASKVDANSLTLIQRGDAGERMTTFALTPQSKVFVETSEDTVIKGEGGRERKIPKTREGKVADVKVEQRITVTFTEAGKADSIRILRPLAPRKNETDR